MRRRATDRTTIRLDVAGGGYDIVVEAGCLDSIGPFVATVAGPSSVMVVTGSGPVSQYADRVSISLWRAGVPCAVQRLPSGERFKRLATVERLCDAMVAARLDRHSAVVAVGGGVIGDLAGFAAAIYMRGIACVQVPTTLLAQVDASVGGKTGVNLRGGKNLVGAFRQPRAVLIDPTTLGTLPARELRCGLAEALKHGFIRDPEYLDCLLSDMRRLQRREPEALGRAIAGSCRIKADVVGQDETEKGTRAVLNFGHTVGHAVETVGGYRRLRHGEAVAIGMAVAALIGEEIGVTPANVTATVRDALKRAGLPLAVPQDMSSERVIEAMASDKKSAEGSPRFVLLRRIGQAEPGFTVATEVVRRALDRARAE
jgi:3-dehydroquinate synthase